MRMQRRGSSLIEVLMAGAMLAVGMTGALLLLLRGAEESRDAVWTVNASSMSMTALEELSSGDISSLDSRAGMTAVTDPTTGRSFNRIVQVTNLSDAGINARQVSVSVEWTSHAGGGASIMSDGGYGHVQTVTMVVSEVIDAGP